MKQQDAEGKRIVARQEAEERHIAARHEAARKAKEQQLAKHRETGLKLKQNIHSKYDEMEDIAWYHPADYKYRKGDLGLYAIYAYIGKRQNHVWIRFRCGVMSRGWLFLEKLIFLRNDEDRIELSVGSNRESDILSGGFIKEWVDLPVDKILNANLLLIGLADKVKVRFSGSRKAMDFVLTPKERTDILTILQYADWLEKEQEHIATDGIR